MYTRGEGEIRLTLATSSAHLLLHEKLEAGKLLIDG
jgi:hypothetical protein